MKQKDIEILLSQVQTFLEPKIDLEQYQTPPRIAAMILWRAYQLGHIENRTVGDFCCGTGMFGIGAKQLGAKKVIGLEIDKEAVEIANQNATKLDIDVKFVEEDVRTTNRRFDTVFMNSPFGIQGEIKDQEFLLAALNASNVTYSIHLYQERNIDFLKNFVRDNNKEVKEIIKAQFEIPRIYHFHTKKQHVIEVAILQSK
jgi:putative methylase